MPQYILVLRDVEGGGAPPTEEELHAIFRKFGAWKEEMVKKGHLRGGEKLKDGEGRILRRANGTVTTSTGPYRAKDEVMGGYFLIDARDYEEATALAKSCPQLDFGPIEVREIDQI